MGATDDSRIATGAAAACMPGEVEVETRGEKQGTLINYQDKLSDALSSSQSVEGNTDDDDFSSKHGCKSVVSPTTNASPESTNALLQQSENLDVHDIPHHSDDSDELNPSTSVSAMLSNCNQDNIHCRPRSTSHTIALRTSSSPTVSSGITRQRAATQIDLTSANLPNPGVRSLTMPAEPRTNVSTLYLMHGEQNIISFARSPYG